jgi:hypothetical protein
VSNHAEGFAFFLLGPEVMGRVKGMMTVSREETVTDPKHIVPVAAAR